MSISATTADNGRAGFTHFPRVQFVVRVILNAPRLAKSISVVSASGQYSRTGLLFGRSLSGAFSADLIDEMQKREILY